MSDILAAACLANNYIDRCASCVVFVLVHCHSSELGLFRVYFDKRILFDHFVPSQLASRFLVFQ